MRYSRRRRHRRWLCVVMLRCAPTGSRSQRASAAGFAVVPKALRGRRWRRRASERAQKVRPFATNQKRRVRSFRILLFVRSLWICLRFVVRLVRLTCFRSSAWLPASCLLAGRRSPPVPRDDFALSFHCSRAPPLSLFASVGWLARRARRVWREDGGRRQAVTRSRPPPRSAVGSTCLNHERMQARLSVSAPGRRRGARVCPPTLAARLDNGPGDCDAMRLRQRFATANSNDGPTHTPKSNQVKQYNTSRGFRSQTAPFASRRFLTSRLFMARARVGRRAGRHAARVGPPGWHLAGREGLRAGARSTARRAHTRRPGRHCGPACRV